MGTIPYATELNYYLLVSRDKKDIVGILGSYEDFDTIEEGYKDWIGSKPEDFEVTYDTVEEFEDYMGEVKLTEVLLWKDIRFIEVD